MRGNRNSSRALSIALLVLMTACGGSGTSLAPEPPAGPIAADFALEDLGGKTLRLSDFAGRPVLLAFWASWCSPCRLEMESLYRLQERFEPGGFTVIIISLDADRDDVREFFAEEPRLFPIVFGSGRVTADYGGIRGIPTTFVLRKDRTISAKFVGFRDYETLEAAVDTAIRPMDK